MPIAGWICLYVDNWSIGLDLYIILATVPMVIAQILNTYRREREPQPDSHRGSVGVVAAFPPARARGSHACGVSAPRRRRVHV